MGGFISNSLNSLKGGYICDGYRVLNGDTRILEDGSVIV